MKNTLTLVLLLLAQWLAAQTQADMNIEAYQNLKKADDTLNAVYNDVLSKYSKDSLFIKNLKAAQRLWINFRDAELDMKYPDYPIPHYGSFQPVCRARYLQMLTEQRTVTLKQWLAGDDEYELCGGSVQARTYIEPENGLKAQIKNHKYLTLISDIKSDYRLIGYELPDANARKLLLISVYTNEVKYNPMNCKYGSYYNTESMGNRKLKWIEDLGDFQKLILTEDSQTLDTLYVESEYVEFDN